MNNRIFVLCTGRCGSTTFIQACSHATNVTAGHETHSRLVGPQRLVYPDHHIEADNRLSFMLGRLDEIYGQAARYVHLTRNPVATARSLAKRIDRPRSLSLAWHRGILTQSSTQKAEQSMLDLIENISANIKLFLRDKDWIPVRLERVQTDFPMFWGWAKLQGSLSAAMQEWKTKYNASS